MAPSLRASESPLEASQRERKAIAKLTLAFICVSLAVHGLFGAVYRPLAIPVEPAPHETTLWVGPLETPTPSPPNPTPALAARRQSTPQPDAQSHQPRVQPPHPRPGITGVPESPGPGPTPTDGAVGPTDGPAPTATAEPEQTFTPCRIVRKVEPQYPDFVKQSGTQGSVSIVVLIGPNGEALTARVGESSGNKALDEAALAAARASTYQCPPAAGRQAELYQVIYQFTLDQ